MGLCISRDGYECVCMYMYQCVCVHVYPYMYHSYNQQENQELAVFEMVDFTE